MMDYCTKYILTRELFETTKTCSIIHAHMSVCKGYSIPDNICTDGSANFTTTQFDQWCQDYSVNHMMSSLYHAASNKKAKSAMKITKSVLKDSTNVQKLSAALLHTMAHPLDATCQLQLNLGLTEGLKLTSLWK